MTTERSSLSEALREIAESIVDTRTDEGKTLLRAALEIERLRGALALIASPELSGRTEARAIARKALDG